MAEYIDREEAKFRFTTAFPQLGISVEKAVYQAIDDVPPADVAPVVHAHWIDTEDAGDMAQCSACNECYDCTEEMFGAFAMFYRYCPSCGAKMDEQQKTGAAYTVPATGK